MNLARRLLSGACALLVASVAVADLSAAATRAGPKISGKIVDLAVLAGEVKALRGLTAEGPVVAHFTKAPSGAVPSTPDDEETAEPDTFDLALRALGILSKGESLVGPPQGETLGSFDSLTDVIQIDSALLPAIQDLTAAHEIVHLLQDREFDLDAVYRAGGDSDASLAVEALVEGDADFSAYGWSATAQSRGEQADVKPTRYDSVFVPGDYGAYLDDLLAFPYSAGQGFVAALHEQGGYAAVDAAFRDPPATTEQVLHPEKYLDGEEAEQVDGPRSPGDGWFPEFLNQTFGEFDVGQMFLPLGQEEAAQIGDGWGGGQLDIYRRKNQVAVAVTLAFDSRADADEACEAVPEWWTALDGARPRQEGQAVKGPRGYVAFNCTGDEVRIGVAPQAALAESFSQR